MERGKNTMVSYMARKLNGKKLPTLGPNKQTRLRVFKKKSTFIYRTYATSLPLFKPFSYYCNKRLKSRSPQHQHSPTHPAEADELCQVPSLVLSCSPSSCCCGACVLADNSTARVTTTTTQLRRCQQRAA